MNFEFTELERDSITAVFRDFVDRGKSVNPDWYSYNSDVIEVFTESVIKTVDDFEYGMTITITPCYINSADLDKITRHLNMEICHSDTGELDEYSYRSVFGLCERLHEILDEIVEVQSS